MDLFAPQFAALALAMIAGATPTVPTTKTFLTLLIGWVLCNGKRTTSGLIRSAHSHADKSHDAYHHFFANGRWCVEGLFKALFLIAVPALKKIGATLWLAGDDTLAKHYGRKIWGAGLYRDACRSSRKHIAYAWGHNWVLLVMIVELSFLKGRLIALPILPRLHPKDNTVRKKGRGSKNKKTTVTIMADMVATVTTWLPDAHFLFCGDGAYAGIAKILPPNVTLVSRLRKDAALYAKPSKRRKKRRGRHPKKGKRLPTPAVRANRPSGWKLFTLKLYGETVKRYVQQYQALWHDGCPHSMVNIIAVRDPEGKKDTEFFFTTDLKMSAEQIIYTYTGRWPIEVVFRESKQFLGLQDGQARTANAVQRITPFCLWVNALIKLWFITDYKNAKQFLPSIDPWYTHKSTISFQDMLGALRKEYWQNLFSTRSSVFVDTGKLLSSLVETLARAK
jgi:hypothetical protein